jgi:hypothetical protein
MASTAAVKNRWPESQERIAEGKGAACLSGYLVDLVCLVCGAEGEKSGMNGTGGMDEPDEGSKSEVRDFLND